MLSSSSTYNNFGKAGVMYTPFSFFIPKILCFSISSIIIANSALYSSVSPKYIHTLKNGDCPFVVVIEFIWYWNVCTPSCISFAKSSFANFTHCSSGNFLLLYFFKYIL